MSTDQHHPTVRSMHRVTQSAIRGSVVPVLAKAQPSGRLSGPLLVSLS